MSYEQKEREMEALKSRKEYGALAGMNMGRQAVAPYADCEQSQPAKASRQSSIRERINRTIREAENVMGRAQAAQRAQSIIDQHPEFAELLDALNEF